MIGAMDSRMSQRPRTAPTPYRIREASSPEKTLWLGHIPGKAKKVEVMTMANMGTTGKRWCGRQWSGIDVDVAAWYLC